MSTGRAYSEITADMHGTVRVDNAVLRSPDPYWRLQNIKESNDDLPGTKTSGAVFAGARRGEQDNASNVVALTMERHNVVNRPHLAVSVDLADLSFRCLDELYPCLTSPTRLLQPTTCICC